MPAVFVNDQNRLEIKQALCDLALPPVFCRAICALIQHQVLSCPGKTVKHAYNCRQVGFPVEFDELYAFLDKLTRCLADLGITSTISFVFFINGNPQSDEGAVEFEFAYTGLCV